MPRSAALVAVVGCCRDEGQVNSSWGGRGWIVAAVWRRVVGRVTGVGERDGVEVVLARAVPLPFRGLESVGWAAGSCGSIDSGGRESTMGSSGVGSMVPFV